MIKRFGAIFSATVFLSLHYATTLYINSTFLAEFFSARVVSALFIGGALVNIVLFAIAPALIRTVGARFFLLSFTGLTTLSSVGLAFATRGYQVALHFLIYAGSLSMVFYALDIFLEDISRESHTGEVRGLYLTFINGAIALAPLVVALFAVGENLSRVYFISALIIFPVILFFLHFEEPVARYTIRARLPLKLWWRNHNFRYVTLSRLVLEIFYAVMVIYTPLYLHNVLKFNWMEIGLIFFVMLLAFVIFEWPVGEIADRWLGEKEFMTAGFFISGVSLLAMPFLGHALLAWMGVLFLSRVGASFTEVTTETYFFKKIDEHDPGLVSIFRLAKPVALILGSILGVVTLSYIPFENLFFILAGILVFGFIAATRIKDTL